MARRKDIVRVAELVGDALDLTDVGNGWPGLGVVRSPTGYHPVAIYVGPIGRSQRDREDVERRFQNPGSDRPIMVHEAHEVLLLGLWEEEGQPVLVGMDEAERVGNTTRYSMFMPLQQLRRAARTGWSEHESVSGEKIVAFHPELLPVYLEVRNADIPSFGKNVEAQLDVLATLEPFDPTGTRERRKTSVDRLVRDARFRRDVLGAYDHRCAFCDLNWGLLEGAHVLPAEAEGPDEAWNGLALCSNHHNAFDRHLIFLSPNTREIRLHPRFAKPAGSAASRAFVETTRAIVKAPTSVDLAVREEMLVRRYDFYADKYDWVD